MIKRKIYVVGASKHYMNWMQGELVNDMEKADLVVFTGGEDVSPFFYNRKSHPTTSASSYRDKYERGEFIKAQELNKHCIGICRGSQFLCVMSNGILVQDQENPSYIHPINTYDGKIINISSTHHQAQFPFLLPENEYKILGWTNGASDYHWGQSYQEELNPPKECEIVYYSKTKCLGIQGHPEDIMDYQETIDYLRDLLDKFMMDELQKLDSV